MKQEVLDRLETLPAEPGVYLMKDAKGEVIYVGKAVNLRNRVRSYFRNGGEGDGRAFIPFLDALLDEIEVIVVRTEQEALLLESELIKRFSPRFNVLLRDDKSFICLKIDLSAAWPRLEVERAVQMSRSGGRSETVDLVCSDGRTGTLHLTPEEIQDAVRARESVQREARLPVPRGKNRVRLFGPYSSAASIRETLRFVERQFRLRTCSDRQLTSHEAKGRACLQYQMHRCAGPCIGAVEEAEYAALVHDAVQFLEGRPGELLQRLTAQMNEASASLEFEKAASFRDRLRAIGRSLEKQRVVTEDPVDRDVAGLAAEAGRLVVYLLFLRGGRLIGGHAFPFDDNGLPLDEVLSSFLRRYYDGQVVIPDEVLLPLEIPEPEPLEVWLAERKGGKVAVRTPKRGAKADLIAMAERNAKESLTAHPASREEMKAVLERLQRKLRLNRLPRRIECYDISLFQGDSAVGSGVCFVDGMPFKAGYRRYRIKTVRGTDDFAMLYEVLRRRVEHGDLPDLFLIDGGKGQLASAAAAFRDAGLLPGREFELASLAKSRLLESDDRGEARSDERVFLLDAKDPVVLDQRSPELFVLTRLRDEAHRFAITYHRLTRSKRALFSELDDVPGVGRARRSALLKHFGSMKRLKAASAEDIAQVDGIGPALAEQIFQALQKGPEEVPSPSSADLSVDPLKAVWGRKA